MTLLAKHAHRRLRHRIRSLRRLTRSAVATVAAFTVFGGAAAAAADELGIDVSGHQHPYGTSIDWAAAKRDGVKFAFIKATEGRTYTNPYLAQDWAATRSVGIYHGAYHFARPSIGSAAAQARHFVSKAGLANKPGDLPPVLDLESSGGLGRTALRTWTATWLKTVQTLTGRRPIIYTGPSFWRNAMGNSTAFTAYPLWIAHYGVSRPSVPGGWSAWMFWQGSSTGSVSGIRGDVDMNSFNGTQAQLAALANVALPTEPARTASRVATSISLVSSRSSAYRGQTVSLSGDLTTGKGVLANRKVFLQARPQGQSTWTRIDSPVTDAAGHFTTSTRVTEATSYRAVFPRTRTYTRSVSSVQSVAITPKTSTTVDLLADRTSVRKGSSVKLFGHLRTAAGAALSGKQVRYYLRPAGSSSWTLVDPTRPTMTTIAPTGWHQTYVKPSRTSTYKVVYRGGLRYTRTQSDSVTVTVR